MIRNFLLLFFIMNTLLTTVKSSAETSSCNSLNQSSIGSYFGLSEVQTLAVLYSTEYIKESSEDRTQKLTCLKNSINDQIFNFYLKSSPKDYITAIKSIFNNSTLDANATTSLLFEIHSEWVRRYARFVGQHTHFLDTLEEKPYLKLLPLTAAGGLIYFYVRYTQKLKTFRVFNLYRALPLFGGAAGGSSLSNKTKAIKAIPENHLRLPLSPATIVLDNTDVFKTDDFNLSYQEYMLMRNFSSVSTASVAAYVLVKKYDGPLNQLGGRLNQYLINHKIVQARGGSKTLRFLMKLEKLPLLRITGTAALAFLIERGISFSFDSFTEYRRNKRIDNSIAKLKNHEDKMQFIFLTEIAVLRLQEYIQFLLRPMITEIERITDEYNSTRFCQEYAFVHAHDEVLRNNRSRLGISYNSLHSNYSKYVSSSKNEYMNQIGEIVDRYSHTIEKAKNLITFLKSYLNDHSHHFQDDQNKVYYEFLMRRVNDIYQLGKVSSLDKSRRDNLNLIESNICYQFYQTIDNSVDFDTHLNSSENLNRCLNQDRTYNLEQIDKVLSDADLRRIIYDELRCSPARQSVGPFIFLPAALELRKERVNSR